MAAGREFQGTKSREILSQLIDRVGELSDALDAQAYSNNQIRSRREETPASATLSYLWLSTIREFKRQQCFNDEMHVVFASAITNFVVFLWQMHIFSSVTHLFFKNYYTTFMILGNARVATARLTILDPLVDIIDAPSNCIAASNCTTNSVNFLRSISDFPLLNVNDALNAPCIYVSPEKGVNCKISLTFHSSSFSLISV